MSELQAEKLMDQSPTVSLNPKRSGWIWITIGVITTHLLILLGTTSMDYLYNVWPQESYARIYERPWLALNVRSLNFQGPAEFKAAQQKLELQAHSGNEKDSPFPHFLLAELYNSLNQPDKAVPQYKLVIGNTQNTWLNRIQYRQYADNAHAALAIIYYEQGKSVRAQQEINRITLADQNHEAGLLTSLKDCLDSPERAISICYWAKHSANR
jgi:tetratricopeptide (TPR) repeat protein